MFLDEECRMLVCRQSGCGKTNTVMHMLRRPLVCFDKIYLYPMNIKTIMSQIFNKVGHDVLEIKRLDEIMETSEYPEGNRTIVVFDDHDNALNKIQSKIAIISQMEVSTIFYQSFSVDLIMMYLKN